MECTNYNIVITVMILIMTSYYIGYYSNSTYYRKRNLVIYLHTYIILRVTKLKINNEWKTTTKEGKQINIFHATSDSDVTND